MNRMKSIMNSSLLLFLVGIVYFPFLHNGFVSDDIPGIVQTGASWTWQMVTTDIRFLTRWSSMFQFFIYQCIGISPWGYRLLNVLFHMGAVLLVQAIVSRLVSRRIGFLTALLFAVHPILVESITWISGGVYVHYSAVFLLSFWMFLNSESRDKNQNYWYVSSILFYSMSLFFAEKASVLFGIFFLYVWAYRIGKKSWAKLIPYALVSSVFILYYSTHLVPRMAAVATATGGVDGGLYNPLHQLPLAITTYFKLIVWPSSLTLYHDEVVGPWFAFQMVIFVLYCFSLIYTGWKRKKAFFWLSWFLIPLLPTLTPFRIAWVVAERYAYMSVIGIFVCIAYVFDAMLHWCTSPSALRSQEKFYASSIARLFSPFRKFHIASEATKIFSAPRAIVRFFVVLGIIFIYVSLISRSIIRNRDWTNEDTLWIATAQVSPNVPYTWNNMGDVYSRRGDAKQAIQSFQRAILLNPSYADAHHNLGQVYYSTGETGDALLMFEKALLINPNLWQSHASMAGIYFEKKQYQQSLTHIEKALQLVPDNTSLRAAGEQVKALLEQ